MNKINGTHGDLNRQVGWEHWCRLKRLSCTIALNVLFISEKLEDLLGFFSEDANLVTHLSPYITCTLAYLGCLLTSLCNLFGLQTWVQIEVGLSKELKQLWIFRKVSWKHATHCLYWSRTRFLYMGCVFPSWELSVVSVTWTIALVGPLCGGQNVNEYLIWGFQLCAGPCKWGSWKYLWGRVDKNNDFSL